MVLWKQTDSCEAREQTTTAWRVYTMTMADLAITEIQLARLRGRQSDRTGSIVIPAEFSKGDDLQEGAEAGCLGVGQASGKPTRGDELLDLVSVLKKGSAPYSLWSRARLPTNEPREQAHCNHLFLHP